MGLNLMVPVIQNKILLEQKFTCVLSKSADLSSCEEITCPEKNLKYLLYDSL